MNNNITHLQNEQGVKVEVHEEIESEILNYFKQMHSEPNADRLRAIDKITRNIPKIVSKEHSQLLLKPVDLQEVELAVCQLKVRKAPGLDGFTSNFFHSFWDLIKLEVWQVVEESRSLRRMFAGVNATFIALILKVDMPSKPDKYRPIALCASINHSKSQIFFFHTPATTQAAIARILGFSIANLPSTYLGAPLIASALKHSSWKFLLERLETRLTSWTRKSLNMASRLVLIKAVLQAMPLYLFSILAVPKLVLKEIKLIQRSFLWGSNGLRRKWALVKWEKACLPKNGGGVGLRDPSHSNEVMGARIWWKWLTAPLTPWTSLWIAKYASHFPVEERLRISEVNMGSLIWNSAKQHKSLIQQHNFWEVKNGDIMRFWEDSW
eukprot:PITA_32481